METVPDTSANVVDFLRAQFGRDLVCNASGQPYANLVNVAEILRRDPRAPVVYYDSSRHRIRYSDEPAAAPSDWSDERALKLLEFLQKHWRLHRLTLDTVASGVALVAGENKRNDLQQYLDRLVWDGQRRLDSLACLGLGADDTDYSIRVGANFMIGAVQRAKEPGSQLDNMLVLVGDQGIGKSSAFSILGGDWYGTIHADLANKDFFLSLQSLWLAELAELQSLANPKNIEAYKAIITTRKDRVRLPYGRTVLEVPRQAVLCGSTNDSAFLRDPTGNRRFWPLRCSAIDLAWLKDNRDQLWAEAVSRWRAGECFWEVSAVEQRAAEEDHFEPDVWHEPIAEYLLGKVEIKLHDLLRDAVKLDYSRQDVVAQRRAGKVLARMGWTRGFAGSPKRFRVWRAGHALETCEHSNACDSND